MNPRRQSTVHDLAALRLHRDGTRVLNSDTNLSSRHAKYATRDARGNWIAQDAAGLGTVKKRRSASQPDEDEEDVLDPNGEHLEDAQVVTKDKGKSRARDSDDEEIPDGMNRAQKRRRFDEDMSYLESRGSSVLVPSVGGGLLALPNGDESLEMPPKPSSDLLKCLHHFASTYYTAMGQLSDVTREVRKQRKMRRARKQGEASGASSSPEVIDIDDVSEDSQNPSVEDEHTGTQVPKNDAGRPDGRKMRRPREMRLMEKDMYKLFDGSALMALGMILQHHILEQLEPCVPEGWEKEMALAERVRRADARKEKQANRMRHRRHVVKSESEPVEVESEDEKVVDGTNVVEGTRSSSADTDEDGDRDRGGDEDEDEDEDGEED